MKITTQTIAYINKHYGSVPEGWEPDSTDDVVRSIGAQLAAVEDTEDFGGKFEQVVIVKVVSCEDHPNADRLHVCRIDDGGKTKDVERGDDGLVQVVCGAPNVRAGMLAAWLPPGATVPSTVGTNDPFVLEARALRGVVSSGMMVSPRELAIGDSHEGLLEIAEELGPISPGTSFADYYHLRGDVVIDMENKMFTHRPDCFGWLGLAREIEGINHRAYKSPDWYRIDPEFPAVEGDALPLAVRNELPELVPRFTAIAIRDVKVGTSPVWLQLDLAKHGLRSINNIVDYTNHYMLFTGQPLHAYDYDKVKARSEGQQATIVVRYPKKGEKITLLGGKEIEPREEAIMIATDKELIGVGGVMGGGDTEVDENTKNIILECANFDMYSVRRTSMAHGLFTDAVTRFTKGQSPLQNLAVLWKITDQIRRHAGGKVAGPLVDGNHLAKEVTERGNIHAPVTVSTRFINQRLGWDLSTVEMKQLLENVEFKVQTTDNRLRITAPFWRTDIAIPEDVVEEIGRLYGYDHLPLELPTRDLTPPSKNPLLELKSWIRSTLSAAGANEVLTYSFVHGDLLKKAGQDPAHAYSLSNALSPDLQYFRTGLTPSLLDKIHMNIKAGFDQFVIFEMNKVHYKGEMDADDPNVPNEDNHVALVVAYGDKVQPPGAPYYQARKYLEQIIELSTVTLTPLSDFDLSKDEWGRQLAAPYEPNRSAVIVKDEQIWGVVGEFKASTRRAFKLPACAAGFEIHLAAILAAETTYTPLPRFPKVEQDICLKVPEDTTYKQVFDFVSNHLDNHRPDATHHSLVPVDIYQREGEDRKQITLRLAIASFERTLTDQEVNALLDQVASAAREQLNAERI
jgi:phenylalanyl-tRNA synthetase beta chain